MKSLAALFPVALLAAFFLAFCAFASAPTPLYAAEIVVNTTAEGIVTDGACSLTEAILAANSNTASNGCPAGDDSPIDTIVLASGASYLLTNAYDFDPPAGRFDPSIGTALPTIVTSVVISGNGAIIERSGTSYMRLLRVACLADLTVYNLALRNGGPEGLTNWGGSLRVVESQIEGTEGHGIALKTCFAEGQEREARLMVEGSRIADNQQSGLYIYTDSVSHATVTISNSHILNNQLSGIFNDFSTKLTVIGSTLSGNQRWNEGGALNNWGDAAIISSTLESNHARRGGAIYNAGTLAITGTEIISNVATEYGGALFHDQVGYYHFKDFHISHSRIVNNRAALGGSVAYLNASGGSIHESCLVGNGGIALQYVEGPRVDATRNWWGAPSGPSGYGPGEGDWVSENILYDDFYTEPILACPAAAPDLATYVPLVAFDKAAQAILVDTSTDFDVDDTDGNCTLPEAIIAANTDQPQDQCPAGMGHDLILLEAGSTYNLSTGYANYNMHGLSGLPAITSTITIRGNGATIARSGSDRYRIFYVTEEGYLTLQDLTLRNGSQVHGGAIYNRATVVLDNTQLLSNTALTNGGAIFAVSIIQSNGQLGRLGEVIIRNNSRLAYNQAELGGAIYTQDFASLSIMDSELSFNHAVNGGGIFLRSSTGNLTRARILSNSASENGGGLYNTGHLTIFDSDLIANSAGQLGGGVHQPWAEHVNYGAAPMQIYYSRLLENVAPAQGSALWLTSHGGFVRVHHNCIVDNSAIAVANLEANFPSLINNWWGAADGPSGAGGGSGDRIEAGIDFSPFLTEAPEGCPSK